MENSQITIDELEIKTQKKEPTYFSRIAKLEKKFAKLEKQIEVIIKSLRR